VWEGAVTTTVFDYPEHAPALEPGREYSWKVMPRSEGTLGEPELHPEWASLPATFSVAPTEEIVMACSDVQQVQQDAKDAPEDVRRTGEAMALAQRGFYAAAISLLLPETSREVVLSGDYFAKLDAALTQRDEAARVMLRVLWLDTRQSVLAEKIAP
jgi:hypothetical protein